jgi:hypothetical protein
VTPMECLQSRAIFGKLPSRQGLAGQIIDNPFLQKLRYVGLLLNDVITSGLPTNLKMRQCQ